MVGLSLQELFLILVILLILFGGSQIPRLAGALGTGISEFRRGLKGQPERRPSAPDPPPVKRLSS